MVLSLLSWLQYSLPPELCFSCMLPPLWDDGGFWLFASFFPVPLPVHPPHPYPARSIFKPFIFSDSFTPVMRVVSPQFGPDDPVRKQPRFQSQVDRRHDLYKAHQVALNTMETKLVGTDGRPRSLIVLLRSWQSWRPRLFHIYTQSILVRVIGDKLQASRTAKDWHSQWRAKHNRTSQLVQTRHMEWV